MTAALGVDGVTFDQIEIQGTEPWLAKLQEELRGRIYHSRPLLRVWIPKSNGGRRIADGHMLSMIKQWFRVPVVEQTEDGERRTTEAADRIG